jgi:hypothetical protein
MQRGRNRLRREQRQQCGKNVLDGRPRHDTSISHARPDGCVTIARRIAYNSLPPNIVLFRLLSRRKNKFYETEFT